MRGERIVIWYVIVVVAVMSLKLNIISMIYMCQKCENMLLQVEYTTHQQYNNELNIVPQILEQCDKVTFTSKGWY